MEISGEKTSKINSAPTEIVLPTYILEATRLIISKFSRPCPGRPLLGLLLDYNPKNEFSDTKNLILDVLDAIICNFQVLLPRENLENGVLDQKFYKWIQCF